MVRRCVVCGEAQKKSSQCSFHKFPKNIELRRSWARACFLDEETVTDLILVCSKHFTEDDFDQTMWPARKLLPVAIPAPSLQYRKILPASKASLLADSSEMNLEITEVPDRSTTLQSDRVAPDTSAGHLNLTVSSTSTALSPASSVSSTSSTENTPPKTVRYIGDLTVEHFATPRKSKRHLEFIQREVDAQRKKIKLLRVQKKRLKDKIIQSIRDLLKDLRDEKLISEEAHNALMMEL